MKIDPNNNELFLNWIIDTFTTADIVQDCPSIVSELFECYNNDWLTYCEEENVEVTAEDLTQSEQEFLQETVFPVENCIKYPWVSRLLERGLVIGNETSRRVLNLKLTEDGERVLKELQYGE